MDNIMDNLDMVIKDNKMIITPSEAGVLLLTQVQMFEDTLSSLETKNEFILNQLEAKQNRIEELITAIETVLDMENIPDTVKEILNETYWKIYGVNSDGKEVPFVSEETI